MHLIFILSLVAGLSRGPQLPLPALGMRIDSADRVVRTANITCDTGTLGGQMQVVYYPVTLAGVAGMLALQYDSSLHVMSCLWTTANPAAHASFAYLVSHNPKSSFARATKDLAPSATQKQFDRLRAYFERINGLAESHPETSQPKSDLMWEIKREFISLRLEHGCISYWCIRSGFEESH
jgi:hypothetical protein